METAVQRRALPAETPGILFRNARWSVGDSYETALAEAVNGLSKAEVIHRHGSWHSFEAVQYATLELVHWFKNRRLLDPIGNIPPAETEANFYAAPEADGMAV